MRELLDALHELKGEGSFTGHRTINSTLLPKTGVLPAKQINNGAWKAVDNMLRIYYYIWLSVRCVLADHRDEGASYVRSQLTLQRQRIRGDLSIDVGVKKFFDEIDRKWLSDIDTMVDRSKPFDNEPFNSDHMVNHFEYDEPVRELRKLVGRKSQIRELSEAWSGSHMQVVEITAPVLCGSTSLFLAVANSIRPGNGAAHLPDGKAVAHVCIGHLTSNTQAMSQVANGLYDELRPYLIDPPRKSKLNEEPIRVLGFMIRKICEERILIMGFDDVDRLERVVREREDLRRFMRFIFHLSEILPQFGIALIGALDRADAYQELRAQTTRFAKPIQLGAIGNNDRRGTIEKLLNGPIDDFPLRFTPSAITEIIKLSGGVPYLTQLIAWNTYERVLANGVSDPDVTREETFCWDPLITKDAVKEVLKLSTFRVGWEYYVRRLEEHFENDWNIVLSILGQYSSAPELGHATSDFERPRTSRKRSQVESRVPLILNRLTNHRVLEEAPDTGLFYLRVGLMNPELLKQLNELTDTPAT